MVGQLLAGCFLACLLGGFFSFCWFPFFILHLAHAFVKKKASSAGA